MHLSRLARGSFGDCLLITSIFKSDTAVFTVLNAAAAIRLWSEAVADIVAKVFGLYDYYCTADLFFIRLLSMNDAPLCSIITVVYNAELLVERTMQSVQSQTLLSYEHIVIDGASKDRTLDIVKRFERTALRVFSEPDKGIYDAMNKGLKHAKGTFVIFMNGGDEFYDEHVLKRVLEGNEDTDFIYGETAVVDEHGNVLGDRRLKPPAKLTWRSLQRGMCVSHQSILVRRELTEPYDLNYKISGDIDWTIRMLRKSKSIVNAGCYISKFLEGGVSASRRKQGLKERFHIMQKHYGLTTTLLNHFFILLRYPVHRLTRRSMT
jgi:glycosyltransferase involved in cell wall biosynthesis